MSRLRLLIGPRGNVSPPPSGVTSVSVYGGTIQFNFGEQHQSGTFVTGDPWVLAGSGNPLSLVSTTPTYTATGSGVDSSSAAYSNRKMHGAQVNPGNRADVGGSTSANTWGTGQGYDDYKDENLNLAFSDALNVDPAKTGSSLVLEEGAIVKANSSVVPEASGRPVLADLGVLTVVRTAPAATQFRPPIAVADKEAYKLHTSDVDLSFLPNLAVPAGAESAVPSYEAILAKTSRMWTVQSTNNLQCRNINAVNNQTEYGQNISYDIGDALALLCLNVSTTDQKRALAHNLIQIGWDMYGRWVEGGRPPGIGGNPWQKLCIVFAAKACEGSAEWGSALADCVNTALHPRDFAEDSMIFRIRRWFIDSPRKTNDPGRPRDPYLPYMEGMVEWSNDYEVNDSAGSNKDLVYRPIVSPALTGCLFYLWLMGCADLYNSPDAFEYMDVYFNWAKPDPTGQVNRYRPITRAMYDTYRGTTGASDVTWVDAAAEGQYVWLESASLLDVNTVPAASALAVTVASSPATVSSVVVYRKRLVAVLSTPITAGQAVTIGYTKPGANAVRTIANVEAATVAPMAATNNTDKLPPTSTPELIDNGGAAYLTSVTPLAPRLAYGAAKRFLVAAWFEPEDIGGAPVNTNLLASQTAATVRWTFVNNTQMTFMVGSNAICRVRPSPTIAAGPQVHACLIDFTKAAAADGAKYGINGVVVAQGSTTFDSLSGTRELVLAGLPDPDSDPGVLSTGVGVLAASLGANLMNGKVGYLYLHFDDGTETWPEFDAALLANFDPANIGSRGEGPLGFRPKFFWPMSLSELVANGYVENRGTGGDRPSFSVGAFT